MKAREVLARVYVAKNDGKKVIATLQPVLDAGDKNNLVPSIRRLLWEGWMLDKQYAPLRADLDDAIATGTRETVAVAQLVRGDLDRLEGKKEDAVMDYLRTVILFEQFKDLQPEALFKAAQAMDDLRDPGRGVAEAAGENYPDSPQAKELGGKM